MNDLEINSLADGIFAYIKEQSSNPLDGITIIGFVLLQIYDRGTDGTMPIEGFAEDFKQSLIKSYQANSNEGSGSIQ